MYWTLVTLRRKLWFGHGREPWKLVNAIRQPRSQFITGTPRLTWSIAIVFFWFFEAGSQ
jgi:hypothetical protein